jgi:DNA-binding response OmpR family regulator
LTLREVVRRPAATASAPVILLTALSGQRGRLTGLDCGADDHITKPFNLKDFTVRFEGLIQACAEHFVAPPKRRCRTDPDS